MRNTLQFTIHWMRYLGGWGYKRGSWWGSIKTQHWYRWCQSDTTLGRSSATRTPGDFGWCCWWCWWWCCWWCWWRWVTRTLVSLVSHSCCWCWCWSFSYFCSRCSFYWGQCWISIADADVNASCADADVDADVDATDATDADASGVTPPLGALVPLAPLGVLPARCRKKMLLYYDLESEDLYCKRLLLEYQVPSG